MKKLSLLLYLLITVSTIFSQKTCRGPKCVEDFLKNKLYILESGSSYFDSSLKSVMEQHWKISEIGGYISVKEIKEMKKSNENSFLAVENFSWSGGHNNTLHGTSLLVYRGKTNYPMSPNALTTTAFGNLSGEMPDSSVYRLV